MTPLRTIKGYVTVLPTNANETGARVAVEEDGIAYHVIPRGAGVDLDDHLSAFIQVTGLVHQDEDETRFIAVRAYTLLEDDAWLEE